MDIKSKHESRLQKAALSCDSFTTGYFVLFALFIVPHIATGSGRIILWFLPLACLVPFAVMPLVYFAVHKRDALLFGRYHLVMPLSTFLSALFFVLIWQDDGMGVCAFFGTLVFAISIAVYRYCAYSVRARLSGDNIISVSPYAQVFSAAGALGAIGTLCGFMYYDMSTAYINTAYVLSGVSILLSMMQYLITYYYIPQLGGRRNQSVKNMFGTFFIGLDKHIYFRSLLFGAAFMCLTALTVFFAFLHGMHIYYAAIVAAVEAGCYCAARSVFARVLAHRHKSLPAVTFAGIAAASVLLAAATLSDVSSGAAMVLASAASGITGIVGALGVRQAELGFICIKPRITSGTVFILLELTGLAATAIALTVSAAVAEILFATGAVVTVCICGIAASAVFAAAALASGIKRRSARTGVEDASDVIEEMSVSAPFEADNDI